MYTIPIHPPSTRPKNKDSPTPQSYLDPNQLIKLAIVRGQSSMNNLVSDQKERIKECFSL